VIINIKVMQKDPATPNLLLLLFFECSLSISTRLKQYGSLACLATFFVHLVLYRSWYHVVAFKELGDVVLRGLEG
jgi:hypothetical protein